MFRSMFCRLGIRQFINGDSSSSSSAAKYYCLFSAFQNQNIVVISNSRVTNSIFYSFSTTSSNDSSNSFMVSYLINSCGLSQHQAITASKKLNFKTLSQPDSVLNLLKTYGFTETHISKLITKDPSILSSKPDKTLKPKFDFFNSKGLYGIDLANYISIHPFILMRSLNKEIIPCFDILKSIVHSDQNIVTMIRRNSWIISTSQVKTVLVNVEHLRNEGVPEDNIVKCLIHQPRVYTENANRFKEIVEKVKDMGFNHLQTTFLRAIHVLASMSEVNWVKKMDVYKRWGWSEDQIQSAFRKNPGCMRASEEKIMAIMNFLVNEMNYESSGVAKNPIVLNLSLAKRIIPRYSIIRALVSRGLIKEDISLSTLEMVDESFLRKFVKKYEQEVPGLMQVFEGQLNYSELLQN